MTKEIDLSSGTYKIQSDLLYELLTFGDGQTTKKLNIGGNWSNGHNIIVAKGILTWLTEQAFNTRCMPWQPDTCFSCSLDSNLLARVTRELIHLIDTDPAVVNAAVEELRVMRDQHATWVHDHSNVPIIKVDGIDFVSLGRAYLDEQGVKNGTGYATRLYQLKMASERLQATGEQNIPDIRVPHDLLTSWSKTACYPKRSVNVQMLIPINDILCSADFLQTRHLSTPSIPAIEPGEWIVLTTNPTGLRKIPADVISLSNGELPLKNFEMSNLDSCRRTLETGFPLNKGASGFSISNAIVYGNRIRELPWYKRFEPAWKVLRGQQL